MREYLELRIPEQVAKRVLLPDEGKLLGKTVRQLSLPLESARLQELRVAFDRERARGEEHPYFFWNVRREYDQQELDSAQFFEMFVERTFEPAGEECGTVYDEAPACPFCRAGRKLLSPLRLRTSMLGVNVGIAKTISMDEWLISEDLKNALLGIPDFDPAALPAAESRDGDSRPWWQLRPTSVAEVSELTRFGIDPFDNQADDPARCPLGHVWGFRRKSQVVLELGPSGPVSVSNVAVGLAQGVARPSPMLIVTREAYRAIHELDPEGASFEPARTAQAS
jgi:hypothetical protein